MAKTLIMLVSLRSAEGGEAILQARGQWFDFLQAKPKTGLLRFARNDTKCGKTLAITFLGAFVFFLILGSSFAQDAALPAKDAAAPVTSLGEIQVGDASSGKISLDLKGVDVIELFKILSMKMNTNIVPTKEVTGRVNVFLNNVTFEDALDIILISNGLAAAKEKNIITIMPIDKYTQQYGKHYAESRKVRTILLKNAAPKDVLAALNQLKSDIGKVIVDEPSATVILMDVPENLDLMEKATRSLDASKDTQIFELKYAKAEDVKNQLASVLTSGSSQVELDARTNKIAVSDLSGKMKKIKKMIEAFDSETRQVLIEAQIVQIKLTDQIQTGIDWEKIFSSDRMRGLDLKSPFSISGLKNNLSVGTIAANQFNLVIQALKQITKINILSRPRIAVVSGQEATILIGEKQVYFTSTQSVSSSGPTTTAESVNFIDVGVKLNVVPTVTADDFIIIKIKPEISSVNGEAKSTNNNRVPIIKTSQAETTVKVKDKAMVMIAGLMEDKATDTRVQFPFLGRLPILSWIFGNKDISKEKSELAIFLTPHIITGDIERVDAEKEEVKARGVVTKRIKEKLE